MTHVGLKTLDGNQHIIPVDAFNGLRAGLRGTTCLPGEPGYEDARTSSTCELRGWVDRRFLGVGVGTGLLGGICCVGGAVAVGLGVSGLSFFGVWMERFQRP